MGKVDLVGHSAASNTLWVIELKVKPGSGRGDTPLRALIELLSYGAVLEANWTYLVREAAARFEVATNSRFPNLLVAGTSQYWHGWRTSDAAGDWHRSLSDLIGTLEARLERRIRLVDIGEVTAEVVKTRPRVKGIIHCRRNS